MAASAVEALKGVIGRSGNALFWVGTTIGLLCLISWSSALGGAPTAPLLWLGDAAGIDMSLVHEAHTWIVDPRRVDFLTVIATWGVWALIAAASIETFLNVRKELRIHDDFQSATYRPLFDIDFFGRHRTTPVTDEERAIDAALRTQEDENHHRIATRSVDETSASGERLRRHGGTLWILIGTLAEAGHLTGLTPVVFLASSVGAVALADVIANATTDARGANVHVPAALLRGLFRTLFALCLPLIPLWLAVGWLTGSWR